MATEREQSSEESKKTNTQNTYIKYLQWDSKGAPASVGLRKQLS